MKTHNTFRSSLGFTLIELLVVISIIALLAALLLPALGQARKAGQAIACQSTLHQQAILMTMYLDTYKDVAPAPYDGRNGRYWADMVIEGIGDPQVKNANFCPSFDPGPYARNRIYGMLRIDANATSNTYIPIGLLKKNIDKHVLLTDTAFIPTGGSGAYQSYRGTYYNNTPDTRRMHMRHLNKANTLFFDLHVAPVDREDLPDLIAPSTTWLSGTNVNLEYGPWSYFDEQGVPRNY